MASMDFDLLEGVFDFPRTSFQTEFRQDSDVRSDEPFVFSKPLDTKLLHQWLCHNVVDQNLQDAHTVVVFTDTKKLSQYAFFAECTADLWWQRLRWTNEEKLHAVFVPILDDNGLTTCHMTHAAVHVLRSLRSRFPGKHFISADADVGPTALSEVWQWINLARECERLRMPRCGVDGRLGCEIMPGLLVCTDKGARANAGLVISPGVGQYDRDLAQTAEAWSRLLEDRLDALMAKRAVSQSDFANHCYSQHMAALANHTKLCGVVVEEPQDYLHLWAVICNVLTVAAWPHAANRHDRARLDAFSDAIRLAIPRVDGWAGPFCEQPALSFLEAFQHRSLPICYMASELGFMMQFASTHIGTLGNVLQSAVMPALFLHGYGASAKEALTKFRLGFWVNMMQSLQGAMLWRPCFMDGKPGSISRVQVSCGFQLELLNLDCPRRMVDQAGWVQTTPSCNVLFLEELSQCTINCPIWPLWSSIVHDQFAHVHGRSIPQDDVSCEQSFASITIACPGLQNQLLEHGRCGHSLFAATSHVSFTNAGRHRVYGPTRERADHEDRSRSDDRNLNALHYILVDQGCFAAWNAVLPRWEEVTLSHVAPCCPSWIADPCSTSVFAVLASIFQFTSLRDSYLRFFGLMSDEMPDIILGDVKASIRGSFDLLSVLLFCVMLAL